MTSPIPRSLVRDQVGRMIAELERLRPGAAARLSIGALAELATWTDIEIRTIPDNESSDGCSVAGLYVATVTPPRLGVGASATPGRRAFTALHELGHHLQRTTLSLAIDLDSQLDHGRRLEEAACDAFASGILIPEHVVEEILGDGGVTAEHVADLWRATDASRAAVCVAAANRLPAPGHVLLLDATSCVAFASSRGLPPPTKGSPQPLEPVSSGMAQLAYRDGIKGASLWVDTSTMGSYQVVVAVTDHAAWRTFSPTSADAPVVAPERICVGCGEEFNTWERPCPRCGVHKCPECGYCSCAEKFAERTCRVCFMTLRVTAFNGDSAVCASCE